MGAAVDAQRLLHGTVYVVRQLVGVPWWPWPWNFQWENQPGATNLWNFKWRFMWIYWASTCMLSFSFWIWGEGAESFPHGSAGCVPGRCPQHRTVQGASGDGCMAGAVKEMDPWKLQTLFNCWIVLQLIQSSIIIYLNRSRPLPFYHLASFFTWEPAGIMSVACRCPQPHDQRRHPMRSLWQVPLVFSMLSPCQAWCYSNIACQYWQFSQTEGCFVDAPMLSKTLVPYPLTTSALSSGADAHNIIAGAGPKNKQTLMNRFTGLLYAVMSAWATTPRLIYLGVPFIHPGLMKTIWWRWCECLSAAGHVGNWCRSSVRLKENTSITTAPTEPLQMWMMPPAFSAMRRPTWPFAGTKVLHVAGLGWWLVCCWPWFWPWLALQPDCRSFTRRHSRHAFARSERFDLRRPGHKTIQR